MGSQSQKNLRDLHTEYRNLKSLTHLLQPYSIKEDPITLLYQNCPKINRIRDIIGLTPTYSYQKHIDRLQL